MESKLTPEQLAILSPAGFAWYASQGKWICPPHIAYLNRKLMDVAAGRCTRLIVTEPPRHGKSEFISKYFPAWFIGMNPDSRVILTSYEASFAASWGRKARDLLVEHGHIFGVRVNQESSAVQDWNILKRNGGMNTAGAGSPITGRGAACIIIDDPTKNAEEAMSALMREKIKEWFKSTLYTRLEPGGAIIIVMTRWHADDLVGWLQDEEKKGGEKWDIINFPAIATHNDILGRNIGEALWPARFPIDVLENIRKATGTFWWSAMYQQNPVPEGGAIIKREWWKYYQTPPDRKSIRRHIWAWDTAVKSGEENDFTVGIYLAETDTGYYLLDLKRDKMEYPELKRAVRQYYENSRASAVIIEDKSSGQQLIQEFQRDTKVPVIAAGEEGKPMADKVTRAMLVTPLIESGVVYLPEQASWLAEFMDECLKFPKAAHDDQIDALVHGLTYLKDSKPSSVDNFLLGVERESSRTF